jgi:hypothetical protein
MNSRQDAKNAKEEPGQEVDELAGLELSVWCLRDKRRLGALAARK